MTGNIAQLKEAYRLEKEKLKLFRPRKFYARVFGVRLFWPYSSGLAGHRMSHQIDTVHWFSGLQHPRSVVNAFICGKMEEKLGIQ